MDDEDNDIKDYDYYNYTTFDYKDVDNDYYKNMSRLNKKNINFVYFFQK